MESVSNGLPLVLRPSSPKYGLPTGTIEKPILLNAHLFFCKEKPIFLEEGATLEKPSFLLASTYTTTRWTLQLPSPPNSPHSPSSPLVQKTPAHLLPHSYRKPPLTFFLIRTENTCSSSFTPTENPSPHSSPLALPIGSSLATLLKPVSSVRRPQGKWSRLALAPRR